MHLDRKLRKLYIGNYSHIFVALVDSMREII